MERLQRKRGNGRVMGKDFTSQLVITTIRKQISASWAELDRINDRIQQTHLAIERSRILLERQRDRAVDNLQLPRASK